MNPGIMLINIGLRKFVSMFLIGVLDLELYGTTKYAVVLRMGQNGT